MEIENTYRITKRFGYIFALVFGVFYLILLIGFCYIIISGKGSLMAFIYLIVLLFGFYVLKDMIKSRNDLIEISSEGIYVSDRNGEANFRWEEIQEIKFVSDVVEVILKNDKIFPIFFDKSQSWIVNFYNFRKNIIYFSNREDIVTVASKWWYLRLF